MKDRALILFLKLPSRGKVKTRLAQVLGDENVLNLYNAFLADILNSCSKADADIILAYSPDSDAEEENRFLIENYRSYMQRGSDLGERMFNAFTDAYSAGYKRSVLIGSDIPEITDVIINRAFASLDEFDVAIGPSADGGYYLIGNKPGSCSGHYFRNIEWSKPDVYKKTLSGMESLGYRIKELETLNDIDDINDLMHFYENNKNKLHLASIKAILSNQELFSLKPECGGYNET